MLSAFYHAWEYVEKDCGGNFNEQDIILTKKDRTYQLICTLDYRLLEFICVGQCYLLQNSLNIFT